LRKEELFEKQKGRKPEQAQQLRAAIKILSSISICVNKFGCYLTINIPAFRAVEAAIIRVSGVSF
jgi:hypothetical protein